MLIFLALVPFELVAKLESDMVIQKNLIAFRHVAFLKRAGFFSGYIFSSCFI